MSDLPRKRSPYHDEFQQALATLLDAFRKTCAGEMSLVRFKAINLQLCARFPGLGLAALRQAAETGAFQIPEQPVAVFKKESPCPT